LLDALGNTVAVHWTQRDDFEDQHVQRTLQKFRSVDAHDAS
jgi:hypothetical protein